MTNKPAAFQDDPRARKFVCPACGAQPDHPCTQPTDTGRRNVRWLHSSRTAKLADGER